MVCICAYLVKIPILGQAPRSTLPPVSQLPPHQYRAVTGLDVDGARHCRGGRRVIVGRYDAKVVEIRILNPQRDNAIGASNRSCMPVRQSDRHR